MPTTTRIPQALTFEEAIASARALAPRVREEAAETEARSHHSEGLHQAFLEAGFYHLLRPRMFGGYEFTLAQFLQVMREIARADMSTGWCLTLASSHNLQIASFWPEEAQRQIFDSGYVAAPMTSTPAGRLIRVEGGFRIEGTHRYGSGSPFSTHYCGHAFHDDRPDVVSAFIAPRDTYTVEDDWGGTLGLRGSGSNSVTFDGAFLPAEFVLEGVTQVTYDVSNGTPGRTLHGNPMYGAPTMGFFTVELSSLAIAAAEAAFDEFEALMSTRRLTIPPFSLRIDDLQYQTTFGQIRTRLDGALALVRWAADHFQECIETQAFVTPEQDLRIYQAGVVAGEIAFDTVGESILRTIGSSAAVTGSRFERIWRDLSQWRGHVTASVKESTAAMYTRARFGVGEFAPEPAEPQPR